MILFCKECGLDHFRLQFNKTKRTWTANCTKCSWGVKIKVGGE